MNEAVNTEKANNTININVNNSSESYNEAESYFDGNIFQLIGWRILGVIVTLVTFGICFPWAFCMIYRWETKHTVINGLRLEFDGTALQLFGNWIKWFLLTLITFGIYSIVVVISFKKWKTKHTHFE